MNDSKSFNLEDVVFEELKLKKFIKDRFVPCVMSKNELLRINHPILHLKFNSPLKGSNQKFDLMGIGVAELYAYIDNDKKCLYVLIPMNNIDQLRGFIDTLGFPWNVSEQDYNSRDFDMLLWDKDKLHISLLNNGSSGGNGNKLLIITNLKTQELINDSPWE